MLMPSVQLVNVPSVPSLLLIKLPLKSTHYTMGSTSTLPSLVLILISSAKIPFAVPLNLLRRSSMIPRLGSLMSMKSFWLEGPLVFLSLFWTSLMARSPISQSTLMRLSPMVLLSRLLSSLVIHQRCGIFTPPIKPMALTKCSEIFSIYSDNQSGVLILNLQR